MAGTGYQRKGNRLISVARINYYLEEFIFVPWHELLHCYAAHWLGVPILLQDSTVYFFRPSLIKDLLITLAPLIFSLLFLGWAFYSFTFLSNHSTTALIVFAIQSWYSLRHLELCKFDLIDAYHRLTR